MADVYKDINSSLGDGGGGGDVDSVFGRTGDVTAATSDYDAAQVDFTPDGDIAATNAQAAIVEVRDDTDTKLSGKEDTANKGVANGYASLDGTGRIPSAQMNLNALEYKGAWDAATNAPALASGVGTTGDTYCVSVAGATNLDGITDWGVGDFVIFNGTVWQKIDNTDAIMSVNGQTGVVSLDTDDIPEAITNLYYTDGRVAAAPAVVANTAKVSADGSVTTHSDVTDAGSGAIITNAERLSVSTALQNGDNVSELVNDAGYVTSGTAPVTSVNTATGAVVLDTDDIGEGATNLYYTEARVSANTDVAASIAHRDGGANKHDASEIDVEGTYSSIMPSAPTDLETALSEINANAQARFVTVVAPTNTAADSTNIDVAINAAHAAGGGIVQLIEGIYDVTTHMVSTSFNNVVLQGAGAGTILRSSTDSCLSFNGDSFVVIGVALNNTTANATSIFTTTAADAGLVAVGEKIIFSGTEAVTGNAEDEENIVISTNVGSGEIVLKYPIKFSLTSATLDNSSVNADSNLVLRDFRIIKEDTGGAHAVQVAHSTGVVIENLIIEGELSADGFTQSAIAINTCFGTTVRNCSISNLDNISGISATESVKTKVLDCTLRGLNPSAAVSTAPIRLQADSHGSWVIRNQIESCTGLAAIWANAPINRIQVMQNEIINIQGRGIEIEGNDMLVSANRVQNTSSHSINVSGARQRCIVTDNMLVGAGATGISIGTNTGETVIGQNVVLGSVTEGILATTGNISINANRIEDAGTDGISLNTGILGVGKILGNTILNSARLAVGDGISIGGENIIVSGNCVDGTTATFSPCLAIAGSCRVVKIDSNIFTNAVSANVNFITGCSDIAFTNNSVVGGAGAVNVQDNISQVVFSGNNIVDCPGSGISMAAPTFGNSNFTITNNNITGATVGGDGMNLQALRNSVVAFNSCTGNAGNGIEIRDGVTLSDNLLLMGNECSGNTAAAFNITSTGSIRREQNSPTAKVRENLAGLDIDFEGDYILTKTLSANTTLTISNPQLDKVVTLEVDSPAAETLTLPASVTVLSGTYDTGGAVNVISLLCVDDATPEYVATILQK